MLDLLAGGGVPCRRQAPDGMDQRDLRLPDGGARPLAGRRELLLGCQDGSRQLGLLVRDQLDLLMNSDICNEYSFLEVYESIMFTFLRGISTEKGARVLEDFICEYRKNQVKPDETKE